MSKQDDIQFCQIAIQAGMVTQEQAKKCLAFAQKVENEGKTRPRIGSVFVKANMLSQAQVSQIKAAVAKRNGARPGAGKSVKKSRGRGGPQARGRGRGRGRARQAQDEDSGRRRPAAGGRRKVSKEMAWLYIGSGIGVIVLLVVMVFMILNASKQADEADKSNKELAKSNLPENNLEGDILEGAGDATAKGNGGRPQEVSKDSDTYKDFAGDKTTALTDAKQNFRDEQYAKALNVLTNFLSKNESNFKNWPDEKEAVTKAIEDLKSKFDQEIKNTLEDNADKPKDEQLKALERMKDLAKGATEFEEKVDAEIKKITG